MISQHKGKINRRYGGIWNEERDEFLYANYGTLTAEHLATRFNNKFKTRFTVKAVHNRAYDLGIDARDCQGMLTVIDAAKQLGIDFSKISKFILRNNLETVGKGKFTYLTDETWRAVQAEWPVIPEPTMTPAEAAKRLNYSPDTIWKHYIKKELLRAYRHGKLWRVAVADVERMEREQRGGKYL